MRKTYYIGGSPCSGKSTVAEAIAKKYNLYYFKVDDFLDEYTEMGAARGKPICSKLKHMTSEQIWMRDPRIQKEEELLFYNEVFEFAMEDISKISSQSGIITEGAAFLPHLMKSYNVDKKHYINITPKPEFQIYHFRKRPFVSDVLKNCKDEEKAFINWMERDILFAKEVRKQSEEMGYWTFINEGMLSIEELIKKVCVQFDLEV